MLGDRYLRLEMWTLQVDVVMFWLLDFMVIQKLILSSERGSAGLQGSDLLPSWLLDSEVKSQAK